MMNQIGTATLHWLRSRTSIAKSGLVLGLIATGFVGIGCVNQPQSASADHFDERQGESLLRRPMPRPNLPDRYPIAASAAPAQKVGVARRVGGPWAPKVAGRGWKFIVIHHSASASGSAAAFDREHRAQRGWDELGYHFVIGNGRGSGDGQVEIGPRWVKQKYGAHAKTADNRFNNFGVGICLVGNFENTRPTPSQQRQLATLVAWLMETYNIPPQNVIGHRDTKSTACPGKFMNLSTVREQARKIILAEGRQVPGTEFAGMTAKTELLK